MTFDGVSASVKVMPAGASLASTDHPLARVQTRAADEPGEWLYLTTHDGNLAAALFMHAAGDDVVLKHPVWTEGHRGLVSRLVSVCEAMAEAKDMAAIAVEGVDDNLSDLLHKLGFSPTGDAYHKDVGALPQVA